MLSGPALLRRCLAAPAMAHCSGERDHASRAGQCGPMRTGVVTAGAASVVVKTHRRHGPVGPSGLPLEADELVQRRER
jgi:hypothetical protein